MIRQGMQRPRLFFTLHRLDQFAVLKRFVAFLRGRGRMNWEDSPKRRMLRARMVQVQLRERGIDDPRVLAAMAEVPRHWFCASGIADEEAYGDFPLPIGCGQTISQPLMVADMLQQMRLTGPETVLEVGTGSGYNAALLSRLATRVISLEILPALAESARLRLQRGGFLNVEVHQADGTLGWASDAPYDSIVVTAGAPEVPPALLEQLKPAGRLVIPVGNLVAQKLLVVQRTAEGFQTAEHTDCRFVPLLGRNGWQQTAEWFMIDEKDGRGW